MRRLLLALPLAFLTFAHAQAQTAEPLSEHASLGPHEHGVARLDGALDGALLELELQSPAMNLVGFEHPASSAADKSAVAATRALLEQPLKLFAIAPAAGCQVNEQTLESPLFGDPAQALVGTADDDDEDKTHAHVHSEIHAHYQFTCAHPAALKQLELNTLFSSFPATRVVQVQLIGPNGQQGLDATSDNSALQF